MATAAEDDFFAFLLGEGAGEGLRCCTGERARRMVTEPE